MSVIGGWVLGSSSSEACWEWLFWGNIPFVNPRIHGAKSKASPTKQIPGFNGLIVGAVLLGLMVVDGAVQVTHDGPFLGSISALGSLSPQPHSQTWKIQKNAKKPKIKEPAKAVRVKAWMPSAGAVAYATAPAEGTARLGLLDFLGFWVFPFFS